MTASTTTRPTAEDRANGAFFKVMQSAPMGLLISAALGFALVGIFQFLFYLDVLPFNWQTSLLWVLAIGLAAFFEGLAFFFLLTTVRDFSAGAKREGWIGALASFLLLVYCMWEAHHVAAEFDNNTPEGYWIIAGIVGTITFILRVVELRIALTVTHEYKRKNSLQEAEIQLANWRDTAERLMVELQVIKDREQAESLRIQQEADAKAQEKQELEREEQFRAYVAAQEKVERLERKLISMERNAGTQITSVSQEEMKRKAAEFFKRNNVPPTQQQVAELCRLKDAKSVRIKFPNGSWDAFISLLRAETQEA